MNKKTTPHAEKSVWDIDSVDTKQPQVVAPGAVDPEQDFETQKSKLNKPKTKVATIPEFDLEGLMTDFPTATELQRFVYDRTGIVLDLKGRSNKLKYQVALDCLNGEQPDPAYLGTENPYLDKSEIVPIEAGKQLPPKDPEISKAGPELTTFDTNLFPHPDPDLKSQGQNCQVRFVKYASGMITYEILGPVFMRAVGEKINKYGKMVPEKYIHIDPRTGEQVIVRNDGSVTPLGTRIRGFMKRQRMNSSNMWDIWVDRDVVVREEFVSDNPWQV